MQCMITITDRGDAINPPHADSAQDTAKVNFHVVDGSPVGGIECRLVKKGVCAGIVRLIAARKPRKSHAS